MPFIDNEELYYLFNLMNFHFRVTDGFLPNDVFVNMRYTDILDRCARSRFFLYLPHESHIKSGSTFKNVLFHSISMRCVSLFF